ncbi:MAG: DMT family transporter [Vicinamibacteria bacterium]|nr:DMT family transporter [Vicinamibacteria bacterium]
MTTLAHRRSPGPALALLSALLFGASTPLAKLLLGELSPLVLAGLLYSGSGLGLWLIRLLGPRGGHEAPLTRTDVPWLAGAVLLGGIAAPVLLLTGLRVTPASVVSLLLNLEGVLTALLAWFVFRENFDRRIALGMLLIVAGGAVLSWQSRTGTAPLLGVLAVVGACLCWALDNNLTQRISGGDPLQIAAIKGTVAGLVNLGTAWATGAHLPGLGESAAALVVGLLGYGISLVLFVLALRHLGTARTGAYFSLAPFFGAAASLLLLHESVGPGFVAAAALMAAGVWLHLTERHDHEHTHDPVEHAHSHVHDDHHDHDHSPGTTPGEPHSHAHSHAPQTHAHPHYPDTHHRHDH